MLNFGRFETVRELHRGSLSTVFVARAAGESGFVLKVLCPPEKVLGRAGVEAAVEQFLNRAQTQSKIATSERGHRDSCWAPIYDQSITEGGAYYATEYFPLSAQKLVVGRAGVNAKVLHAVVTGTVEGLRELAAACGRPHGNLKLTNILMSSSTASGVAAGRVVLTDPLADSERRGDQDAVRDRRQLGELIYRLVVHKPVPGPAGWPVKLSPSWRGLGREARGWLALCNSLLDPQLPRRLMTLEDLADQVRALRPRNHKRVQVMVLLALIAASAVAAYLWTRSPGPPPREPERKVAFDEKAWQQLCNEYHDWFAHFVDDLDQQLLDAYRSDDQLQEIVGLLGEDVIKLDPRTIAGIQAQQIAYRKLGQHPPKTVHAGKAVEQTRHALQVIIGIRGVLEGLAAVNWPRFSRVRGLPDEYAHRLATEILSKDPFKVVEGIKELFNYEKELEETKGIWDRVSSLMTDLDKLGKDLVEHGGPGTAGRVASRLDLLQKRSGELHQIPWSRKTKPQIEQGLVDLQKTIQSVEVELAAERTRLAQSFEELVEQLRQRRSVVAGSEVLDRIWRRECNQLISRAEAASWTQFQLSDYVNRLEDLLNQIDERFTSSLGVNLRSRNWNTRLSREWLPDLRGRSLDRTVDQIDWALALETSVGNLLLEQWVGKDAEIYEQQRAAAARLVADFNRLEDLLDDGYGFAQSPDNRTSSSIEQIYESWQGDELLRDDKIANIVGALVQRVENVISAEQETNRDELVRMARSAAEQDLALAMTVWRRLGDVDWPAEHQSIEDERLIQERFRGVIGRASNDDRRQALQDELAEGARRRWVAHFERLSETSDIDQAIDLMGQFGVGDQLLRDQDQPRLWFNWTLYTLRGVDPTLPTEQILEQVRRTYEVTRDVIVGLDRWPAAQVFVDGLEKIVQESQSDQGVDPSTLGPASMEGWSGRTEDPSGGRVIYSWRSNVGQPYALEFARVDSPRGTEKPFYLSTTEVPVGLFIDVVNALGRWASMAPLLGRQDMEDLVEGPRVWAWIDRRRPELGIRVAQSWYQSRPTNLGADRPYYVDDLGSSLDLMRIGRESDRPSSQHPMQHISAAGALYFAALVGCRLPTAAEWQAARAVNMSEQVNLRDQTWSRQQAHIEGVVNGGGVNFQWPDAGIFLPDGEPGDKVLDQADATALSTTDGLLWFAAVGERQTAPFKHLIGNVAEFVYDRPQSFWEVVATDLDVERFKALVDSTLGVIGGSALSPPQLRSDVAYPVASYDRDRAFSDTGLRLAFDAPQMTVAMKLDRLIQSVGYLTPRGN